MFRDVHKMNYADFMRIVKTTSPYRGTDAYPVGSRRYSRRHFIVRDDKVLVWEANLKMAADVRAGKNTNSWVADSHLITIHPDNTVEFHNVRGIGDGGYLSAILGGYIGSSSKHSGTIWSVYVGNEQRVHPVFKGLRVSLDDHSVHPDSQYKMIYRRIIPKEKEKVMGELEKQLTVAQAMLNSMSLDGIKEMYKELRGACKHHQRDEAIRVARQNNHCLDVLIHMALSSRRSYIIEWADSEAVARDRIIDCANKSKRAYLSAQPEAFKYIEREPFDFPTATWGMQVKVGDKFAERL